MEPPLAEPDDPLAEYGDSLHNEDTKYNYRLILLYFFGILGISAEAVQPLRTQIVDLENKKGLSRKDETFQENRQKIQKLKEKILRIQAKEFIAGAKRSAMGLHCRKELVCGTTGSRG